MTNIVFFGSEDFSLASLRELVDNGFPVVAVVTKPDSARNRGHKISQPKVKIFAEQCGIRVLQPNKLSEIADDIASFHKPVGILVSYGKIIPQSIIDLFEPGIINIHPSLLPRYRGPSPVEAAILNGDKSTGISIMQLDAGMDTGPVYHQVEIALHNNETGPELLETLSKRGATELIGVLPNILDYSLKPQPQDNKLATYTHLIQKDAGIVDWNKSALQLSCEVRAYRGWPQSRTQLGEVEVILTKVHVEHGDQLPGEMVQPTPRTLFIGTGKDLISVDAVKPLGKKEMPISAFLSGYKQHLGI